MGRVPARREWPPEPDKLIDHCDESPPLSRRAQLRCGEPRRKEGGGSREGVVLSVWVCCVCLRACVRGACVRVFTARRHAALWKLGREQRGCSGGRHYDSSRG